MKYIGISIIFLLISCSEKKAENAVTLKGLVDEEVEYLIFNNDTITINNGLFMDTFQIDESRYDYITLNTWKWPKLIYVEANRDLHFDFRSAKTEVIDDILNSFLLNSDSLLNPYTLRWDMAEAKFREAMRTELETNINIIDSVFQQESISAEHVNEVKQIETLKVAHRTANFINFQERNGKDIKRDIYDFVKDIDLNNARLANQVNNRNFQYYYLLDKINPELADSIYPFAAIDTVNKYSSIESIRKMIISSVTKSAFYDENVNHDSLFSIYESNFGTLEKDNKLSLLYTKIQSLKPGNKAPDIGQLKNAKGAFFTNDDLQGENVLISVWGSWCPYCRKELPYIKALIENHGDKFVSVGISLDKDEETWKNFIKDHDWEGIHLNDNARNSTFKSNYLVGGTNVHFLIDRNGILLSSKTAKPSSQELEELIANLK